jgi:hypothetical protein
VRRALILLALVIAGGVARAETARPTVAVDFAALDEASYRRLGALALEQRVVLRLAQEGFAVVTRPAEPAILLRLRVLADRVVIEDAAAPAARHREVMTADEPVRELTHLEIAQKIVELARASRALLPPSTSRPAAPVTAASAPPSPPPAPAAWEWELAGGAGGLVREGGTDAQAGLEARAGGTSGWGLRAAAFFTAAGGGAVTAREGQLQLGAGRRVRVAGGFELEAALLAGGLIHHYTLADETARSPSGTRPDFLVSLPVIASVWGWQHTLGLALRLAPGLSGRSREHTADGQALWRRGLLRLELGVGLVGRL